MGTEPAGAPLPFSDSLQCKKTGLKLGFRGNDWFKPSLIPNSGVALSFGFSFKPSFKPKRVLMREIK